jgi:membrane dipeptidase
MLPILVDAHEDLADNILNFGRDYTRAAAETRRIEKDHHSPVLEHNGETLLGWPDYQRGRVAVVFSTLFATPIRRREGEWDKQSYADYDQAHRLYRSQLDVYHQLTDDHPDQFRLIGSRTDLHAVLAGWAETGIAGHPVGLVPLMEGAEGVRTPSELEQWWEWGVRTRVRSPMTGAHCSVRWPTSGSRSISVTWTSSRHGSPSTCTGVPSSPAMPTRLPSFPVMMGTAC